MNVNKIIQENVREKRKEESRAWRKEPTITRLERPSNLPRAKSLGYKAKQGVVLVRVRIKKGKRKTPKPSGGRRPKRAGRFFTPRQSKQAIAEKKANRKYPNLEVLNSYKAGEDGQFKYFEVILIDKNNPNIKKDKQYKNLKGRRAFRGKTSAERKSRGL